MDKKDEFKEFIKSKPELVDLVKNKKYTYILCTENDKENEKIKELVNNNAKLYGNNNIFIFF